MKTYLFSLLLLAFCYACGSSSTDIQQDTTKEEPAPEAVAVAKKTMTAPIDSSLNIDYLRGRFNPATHPDFTKVSPGLTDGDGTYYLRKDAYAAFQEMHAAAAKEGVKLEIVSATRNFDRQKSIWEAKWNGNRLLEGREKAPEVYPVPKDRALAILRWSSMPGTSRHHWGTDMDINKLTNSYFEKGEGLKVYEWLTAHAHEFGFCQPYSPKGTERPNGYNEEKWHWSYEPIARQLTDLASTELRDEQIDGFEGAATAVEIGVVEKYVLGVSQQCKE
ncbi:M15 family metallopeptidase [Lewinella cohaerens]|uniref:M15 family metallopeptidase n=1 Tax=Lewinella cohaerens TaxID=70995 RepID=UPI000375593D|nr:M15 family metallopeptidase [Lewinella cohaerens]